MFPVIQDHFRLQTLHFSPKFWQKSMINVWKLKKEGEDERCCVLVGGRVILVNGSIVESKIGGRRQSGCHDSSQNCCKTWPWSGCLAASHGRLPFYPPGGKTANGQPRRPIQISQSSPSHQRSPPWMAWLPLPPLSCSVQSWTVDGCKSARVRACSVSSAIEATNLGRCSDRVIIQIHWLFHQNRILYDVRFFENLADYVCCVCRLQQDLLTKYNFGIKIWNCLFCNIFAWAPAKQAATIMPSNRFFLLRPKDGAESALLHKGSNKSSNVLLHMPLSAPSFDSYWKQLIGTPYYLPETANKHFSPSKIDTQILAIL